MDEVEDAPQSSGAIVVQDQDLDPIGAPETEVSWIFGVTLAVPVFAVILMFMMRLFGGPPVGPVPPPSPDDPA